MAMNKYIDILFHVGSTFNKEITFQNGKNYSRMRMKNLRVKLAFSEY